MIVMSGLARVTAPGCLVQSNGDISVQDSAELQAGAVQSVGAASGSISPAPQVGAPAIGDPFASMTINPTACCAIRSTWSSDLGVNVLSPGIHCGNHHGAKTGGGRAAAGRALLHEQPA